MSILLHLLDARVHAKRRMIGGRVQLEPEVSACVLLLRPLLAVRVHAWPSSYCVRAYLRHLYTCLSHPGLTSHQL